MAKENTTHLPYHSKSQRPGTARPTRRGRHGAVLARRRGERLRRTNLSKAANRNGSNNRKSLLGKTCRPLRASSSRIAAEASSASDREVARPKTATTTFDDTTTAKIAMPTNPRGMKKNTRWRREPFEGGDEDLLTVEAQTPRESDSISNIINNSTKSKCIIITIAASKIIIGRITVDRRTTLIKVTRQAREPEVATHPGRTLRGRGRKRTSSSNNSDRDQETSAAT